MSNKPATSTMIAHHSRAASQAPMIRQNVMTAAGNPTPHATPRRTIPGIITPTGHPMSEAPSTVTPPRTGGRRVRTTEQLPAVQVRRKGGQERVQAGVVKAIGDRASITAARWQVGKNEALRFKFSQAGDHRGIGRPDGCGDFGPCGALDLGQVANDFLGGRKPKSGQCILLVGREARGVREVRSHQHSVPYSAA